jgi:hypothetical protein
MSATSSHSIVKRIISFDSLCRLVSNVFFGFEVHWIAKERIVTHSQTRRDTFKISRDTAAEIVN